MVKNMISCEANATTDASQSGCSEPTVDSHGLICLAAQMAFEVHVNISIFILSNYITTTLIVTCVWYVRIWSDTHNVCLCFREAIGLL